jgi:hypothetical protein
MRKIMKQLRDEKNPDDISTFREFSKSVSCRLGRWSGGRWALTHGVGDHGLGDLLDEFGGHGREHDLG